MGQIRTPLVTCSKCLAAIVNPNAWSAAGIEPRQVIPLEDEVGGDFRGTIWGLVVLGLTLLAGGLGAVLVAKQSVLGGALIGAAMMSGGGVLYARRRQEAQGMPSPTVDLGSTAGVLDYHRGGRRPVSVLAFLGGFIMAIVIGIICFYSLVATGEKTSVQTRRMVFAGMVVVIVGLIFAAIQLRKRPGWAGFGRGVAIGLALAMMALGPCAACYILTLFG